MDSVKYHVSQRDAFSDTESWLHFLECHSRSFDTLILRESTIEIALVRELSLRLNKPIILNAWFVSTALSKGIKALEEILGFVQGIHIKGDEVKMLRCLGTNGQSFLEELTLRNELVLGTSVHCAAQVESANELWNFDYYLVSPVQKTTCKPDAQVLEIGQREQIMRAAKFNDRQTKLIALGGMHHKELSMAKQMGFDGIAGRNQFLFRE